MNVLICVACDLQISEISNSPLTTKVYLFKSGVPATLAQPKPTVMEENQSSLFGLGIDPTIKIHLSEAARWARFLAIVGFVLCALVVVMGFFAGSVFSIFASKYADAGGYTSGLGAVMSVVYVIFALVYFFPCLFLFRFSSHMKKALASNDQNILTTSFQNLKIMFRYVGILTIIVLAFYAIVILFWVLTISTTVR